MNAFAHPPDPGGRASNDPMSPSTLVAIIAMGVFLVEMFEPNLLGLLPDLPKHSEAAVDALLITAVLALLLHLFLMRPMMAHIGRRERAEEELRNLNESLEQQVAERTEELLEANRRLTKAVADQESAAETLQRNNSFIQSVFNNSGGLLLAFDSGRHQCVYVNGRIKDLLGYDPDGFVAGSENIVERLVSARDRGEFLEEISKITDRPTDHVVWGAFEFLNVNREPVPLFVGLSTVDLTPTGQAKTLLLTAMPGAAPPT